MFIYDAIKSVGISGLFSGLMVAGSVSRFDGYVTDGYLYGEIRVKTYGTEEVYSIFEGQVLLMV